MRKFTAYDKATGQILFNGEMQDLDLMAQTPYGCIPDVRLPPGGWWDGQAHHDLPPQPSPNHQFDYTTKQWVDQRTTQQATSAALVLIDQNVDAIYGAVIGNRAAEYEAAERDAQAWVDAGKAGPAPAAVASWAAASVFTEAEAADDILAQAAAWRGAMQTIRAQRLLAKAAVRAATTPAEVDAAMASWSGFVVTIRGSLGV